MAMIRFDNINRSIIYTLDDHIKSLKSELRDDSDLMFENFYKEKVTF